jgi:hypothetical protein
LDDLLSPYFDIDFCDPSTFRNRYTLSRNRFSAILLKAIFSQVFAKLFLLFRNQDSIPELSCSFL